MSSSVPPARLPVNPLPGAGAGQTSALVLLRLGPDPAPGQVGRIGRSVLVGVASVTMGA